MTFSHLDSCDSIFIITLLGHYAPVTPTGRLLAWKNKAKRHAANIKGSVLTENFQISALLSLSQHSKVHVCMFETSLLDFKNMCFVFFPYFRILDLCRRYNAVFFHFHFSRDPLLQKHYAH